MISWANFLNKDKLGVVRDKLNVFNTSVKADVNKNTNDIQTVDGRVTNLNSDVVSNTNFRLNPKPVIQFNPQTEVPTHVEGNFYYDGVLGTFKGQGPIPGVEVEIGHTMHIHVVNNSGATIEKGMACRHNGVSGGIVQVVKAQADTFVNAEVFGIAEADILNGAFGSIVTFGEIKVLDTSLLAEGVPLYLSATVAGTYSAIRPDIASQIGGVTIANPTTGKLFVSIVNNKSIPNVFGGMQGQSGTGLYNVSTTVQDIINYDISEEVLVDTNILTGVITVPNTGEYRVHFAANIAFPTSTSTRTLYIELYDTTGAEIHFTYNKNIPRDATEDSLSFSFPIAELAGNQHKIRIRSSTNIDVTFQDISFDIESISII